MSPVETQVGIKTKLRRAFFGLNTQETQMLVSGATPDKLKELIEQDRDLRVKVAAAEEIVKRFRDRHT